MTEKEAKRSEKKLPPLSEQEKAAIDSDDVQSREEAKQLGSGLSSDEIQRQAEEAEAGRTERFRDHYENLAIVTLYIVWGALIIIGLAWLYHLIASPSWPRLPDEQVNQLQNIVTGGVLAGLAGGHLKKRLR